MKKILIQSTKGNLSACVHGSGDMLVVLCPGFLDSKDYTHLVELANELADQKYTVVRFDPTGTWDSQGSITDYTTTQYLTDIRNVIDNMTSKKTYKKILLGGHSRGGMVSIIYAAKDPRVTAVLGIMPSSPLSLTGKRLEDWKKTGVNVSHRDLPADKDKKREFRVPYSHVEDRKQYDVITEVQKVKVPLLLFSGELDTLVLPEHVALIYANANQPKKLVVLKGVGHDYRHSIDEVKKVNKEIIAVLKRLG